MIPKALKSKIWYSYVIKRGDKEFCYCCETTRITPFNFECGHVHAKSKGGEDSLENLRPICSLCNRSMKTQNLYTYKNRIHSKKNRPYNNMSIILAFTAPKGSGKDLSADYLVKYQSHPVYPFKKIAFADQLKNMLRTTFNFTDKQLYGTQKDKETIDETYGVSSRQMALAFGDFMRYTLPKNFPNYREKMGSDYFVKHLINTIKNDVDKYSYIISDVRFNNEITEIRKAFANKKVVLIRLQRNTEGYNTETDQHHSENPNNIDVKEIDEIIVNNGTKNQLYQKLNIIVNKYQD